LHPDADSSKFQSRTHKGAQDPGCLLAHQARCRTARGDKHEFLGKAVGDTDVIGQYDRKGATNLNVKFRFPFTTGHEFRESGLVRQNLLKAAYGHRFLGTARSCVRE
jgi:hypothetical protein